MKVFRFRLKISSNPYQDSNPRWNDETTFITEGQEGEMFFREKLDVKLTYQREDFDAIYAADFDTEFRALLQQQVNGVWTSLWVGKFWYTDIEFDVDNRTCTVSPETFDLYEELFGGLEKEFDLIALEPPTVTVQMLKQAVIQVYLPGSSFVANFTNDGIFYETPCTPFNTTPAPFETGTTDNHDNLIEHGFGMGTGYNDPSDGLFNWARVVIPGSGLTPDVSGVYYFQFYFPDGRPGLTSITGTSLIREDGVYSMVTVNPGGPGQAIKYAIKRVSDGVTVYESEQYPTPPFSPFGQAPHTTPNATFTSLTNPSSKVQAYLFMPYVRLLTNKKIVDGLPTIGVQSTGVWSAGTYYFGDVVTWNGRDRICVVASTTNDPDDSGWNTLNEDPIPHGTFARALPIDTLNFIFSEGNSASPTRWGKFSLDALHFALTYFAKPSSSETLMPVAGTTWTGASAWFYMDDDLRNLQQEGSELLTINDAYKLSDCIDVLLDEIQPLIAHADGTTYSQFLYATSNAIRGARKVPIIIPKSNVVVGNYDQPAKKAQIRLSEILQLLRYFHNAYWHISESSLVIEHENYYHNGKSYSGQNIGTDLTTGIEPKTELAWAYRTNKFKFDKQNMPERIETGWMDKGSQQFDGYPIQALSAYAQKGNIEQRVISKFTSDVDFIHVAANDIAKEGFVFLECEEGELYYTVPFVTFVISADETYTMQNGYASLIYAHNQYHKHNLSAESVTLNKSAITATTVKRSKIQEITFATESEIDPYELIETNLGVGRLRRMERQITGNTVKAVILHDIS